MFSLVQETWCFHWCRKHGVFIGAGNTAFSLCRKHDVFIGAENMVFSLVQETRRIHWCSLARSQFYLDHPLVWCDVYGGEEQ